MPLSYPEMQEALMRNLRLYHYPIAVHYFFDEAQLEAFKAANDYVTPVKSLSLCQWEIMARMQGDVVLAGPDNLSCTSAAFCFGWKELDDSIIKGQLRNTRDFEQAKAFLESKTRFAPGNLKAIAVGPLARATRQPEVVHFYCDNMQAMFLGIDYMAATHTPCLRPCLTINSASCGGGVFAYVENTFNTMPACFGGYSSGKTERGETNVFIPGKDIEKVVQRMIERSAIYMNKQSWATDEDAQNMPAPFPGAHVCKNCNRIGFKKGE